METYDEILNRMRDSYTEYAGFVPAEESDIMIRLRVLAGEVYRLRANAAFIDRQLFPTTATGEYLERHAAMRGLSRKQAVRATGQAEFYPDTAEHHDILIPAGTEVCTYTDMLRFRTVEDVMLEENAIRATVAVCAAEPGAAYNVLRETVGVVVTPIPGVGGVNNPAPFSGGADGESDEELRQRIVDSYVNIVNGANAAYYKSLALSVPGVGSASVIGRARGNGTVDVYVCGEGAPVTSAVKAQVQSLMNEGRELNVDVQVCDAVATPVTFYIRIAVIPGYAFQTVADEVQQAVTAYINGLGIGADVRLSDVGEVVYHIKGVESYRFVDGYGSDVLVDDRHYPLVNQIIVRERA